AKALGVVKPLYFTGGTHCGTSSFIVSECRVCGTCRLLFVRGRCGRRCSQKTKKDLAKPQVPEQQNWLGNASCAFPAINVMPQGFTVNELALLSRASSAGSAKPSIASP